MRLEIIVDGQLAEVPPRREEIIRTLLRADLDLDTMEVGVIEFQVAQERVNLRVTRSYRPTRVLRWMEWLRSIQGGTG